MKLETYKQTKRYRVLDSTYYQSEETREMIGGVFERYAKYEDDNSISLYTKDKTDFFCFNKSDLKELTNVIKDGYEIGIGDTVKWNGIERIVYDYAFYDGEWDVFAYNKDKEPFEYCYWLNSEQIQKVIPLKTFKKECMSEDEMIAHLKKTGRIKQGDIIN